MKNKLLIHINESTKWNMLFSNVYNYTNKLANEDYELIIVVNSSAVEGLINEDIVENIKLLTNSKTTFKACNNSLKPRNIDANTLDESIEIVETSVYEIAYRQNFENFAYIKL